MLTANDIRNMTFSKSMGGYKTAEVDVFKDQCAVTVSELTKAKAELEKKLEVLADKLVEYRNDEDNIRSALLNAQRLGDSIIREAKQKAGLIMDDAKIKAENMQESAQRSIRDEENELERIRREITNFKMHILSIYREHLELIDVLPELKEEKPKTETPKAEESSAPVEIAPTDAVAAGQPMKEEQPSAKTGQPAPVLQPMFDSVKQSSASSDVPTDAPDVILNIPVLADEISAAKPAGNPAGFVPGENAVVSRFTNLKFGDDYDISKDHDNTVDFYKRHK